MRIFFYNSNKFFFKQSFNWEFVVLLTSTSFIVFRECLVPIGVWWSLLQTIPYVVFLSNVLICYPHFSGHDQISLTKTMMRSVVKEKLLLYLWLLHYLSYNSDSYYPTDCNDLFSVNGYLIVHAMMIKCWLKFVWHDDNLNIQVVECY